MEALFNNGFVALLFLGFGLVGAWRGWQALQRARASADWPRTPGAIIGSAVHSHNNGEHTFHRTVISYCYDVAGTSYQAKRVFYGDDMALQFAGPGQRRLSLYPIGQPVTVAYDPTAPQEAVLEPGPNQAAYLSLYAPIALALFGALKLLGSLVG
jgi:hypothetical protein